MTLSTLPGAVLGTPKFMAPEQLLGYAEIDARSDLFALGATLFTLLSGEPVRAARTYAPGLQRTTIFATPSLRSAWPDAPAALVAAVDCALRFEPDERWPDAPRMQRALREVHAQLALPAASTVVTRPRALPRHLAEALRPTLALGDTAPALRGSASSRGSLSGDARMRAPSATRRWLARAAKVAFVLALVSGAAAVLLTRDRPDAAAPTRPAAAAIRDPRQSPPAAPALHRPDAGKPADLAAAAAEPAPAKVRRSKPLRATPPASPERVARPAPVKPQDTRTFESDIDVDEVLDPWQ
jgi:serine/threonine-protein kinase